MTPRPLLTLALAAGAVAAAAAAGAAATPAHHREAGTRHVCVIGSSQPSGGGWDGYCVSVWLPLGTAS